MKKALVSTLLVSALAPQYAQANIFSDLLEKFSSINRKEKTECEKMSNEEVAHLCAMDVCGEPENYNVVIDSSNIDKFTSPETVKMVSTFEDKMNSIVVTQRDYLDHVEKQIEDLKNITSISDQEAEDYLKSIGFSIDEKLWQKIIPLSGDNKGKIRRVIPKSSPFYNFYKDVVSTLNVEDNLEVAEVLSGKRIPDKTKIKVAQNRIAKMLQAPNLSTEDKESLEKYKKDLTNKAVDVINSELLAMSKKYDVKLNSPICNDDCKEGIKKFYKEFTYPNLREKYESQFKELDVADRVAQCQAAFVMNSAHSQNTTEIQKEWEQLRQRFIDDSNLKLSSHSKGLLINQIDTRLTVKFDEPIGAPDAILKKLSPSPNISLKPDALSVFYLVNSKEPFAKELAVPSCKFSEKVMSITDHVLPSMTAQGPKAKLHVSPFSCEHVHIGREIMAHELGHAISHFMANTEGMSTESKTDFTALRQCSRSEKKSSWFFSLSPTRYEGDRLTTEEDTADLIAHMLSPDKDSLMSCPMLLPHEGRYQNTRFKKALLDTHSSSMARLLVELQYKNPEKITEACAESIKRSKQKIENKCY